MESERFEEATRAFDAQNAEDPCTVVVDGVERPRELVQADRLTGWILRLEPEASEALRLAARCQHLRRWAFPRSSYPPGRGGYLRWRADAARFHADAAAAILRRVGYGDDVVEKVSHINLKRGLRRDAEVQTMEDALCLSFLEHELASFAEKHSDEEVVRILGKTWRKMSSAARKLALGLELSDRARGLVNEALSEEGAPSRTR